MPAFPSAITGARPAARLFYQGPGGFLPSDKPGLRFWAEAKRSVDVTATKVTAWGDPGFSRFSQPSDPERFVFVPSAGDGLPELTVAGVNKTMLIPSITLSSSFTAFYVVRSSGSGTIGAHGPDAFSGDGDLQDISNSTNSQFYVNRGAAFTGFSVTMDMTTNVYRLLVYECDGTLAGMKVFRDNVLQSTTANAGPGSGISDATEDFYIGSRGGSTRFLTGGLRAALRYDGILSTDDRLEVEGYLNTEYVVF